MCPRQNSNWGSRGGRRGRIPLHQPDRPYLMGVTPECWGWWSGETMCSINPSIASSFYMHPPTFFFLQKENKKLKFLTDDAFSIVNKHQSLCTVSEIVVICNRLCLAACYMRKCSVPTITHSSFYLTLTIFFLLQSLKWKSMTFSAKRTKYQDLNPSLLSILQKVRWRIFNLKSD